MRAPAEAQDEDARLAALRGYEVLDSAREEAFDRITRLASAIFEVPIALVSLVDEARQWFKSDHGLGVSQTPREVSFCGHAILERAPMVVSDAQGDERFADNPLVLGAPHIRFYAGAPLVTPRGQAVGTLCLIDRQPRSLTPAQRQVLSDLAALVVDQLELRRTRLRAEREARQVRALAAALPAPVLVVVQGQVVFANALATALFGGPLEQQGFSALFPQQSAPGPEVRCERRWLDARGDERIVESQGTALPWEGGSAVVVVLHEVGAERRETARRIEQLQQIARVFARLPEGVVLYDQQHRPVFTNDAVLTLFGLAAADIEGWTAEQIAAHVATLCDEPEVALRQMREMHDGRAESHVFAFARPRARVMRRTLHRLDVPERPWLTVWTDITAEAAQLKRTQLEASTDVLTGLPNRRAAEAALVASLSGREPVSVALFDVDHFKRVNDTLGHDVGDEVLQAVAKALASVARAGDLVCRWGGEEFIAVLRSGSSGALAFAERARVAVEQTATAAGKVTVSGGVTEVTQLSDLKRADERLYAAKSAGRNRVMASA